MKIWMNVAPFVLKDTDRQAIQQAWPSAEVICTTGSGATDPNTVDGRDFDVMVGEPVPRDLSRWPKLRLIQLLAAGVDYLAGHPVWASGIPVASARGIHSVPIAEHITCTVLYLLHNLDRAMAFRQTRQWRTPLSLSGDSIRGKTVGIVGYGAVGAEAARQLHMLGARVLCMKNRIDQRTPTHFNVYPGTGDPDGTIPEQWYDPTQLQEMLPRCDALIVTAARTACTRGMIQSAELKQLPRGAMVIITSRGGIVDEQALADALHDGHVAGAAVDTFSVEPPPADNPLFDAPNIITTPHISGDFKNYLSMVTRILCENLARVRDGRHLVNLVDSSLFT